MRRFLVRGGRRLAQLMGAVLLVVFGFGFVLPPYNMPEGVTPTAREIFHLHMFAVYICCGIGVVVFGMMIYCLVKFRKSRGHEATEIHSNLAVEIIWTVVPFILLIILAIPSTKVLEDIHNTSNPDLNIKITGFQWKWKYEYLDQGIKFFSNLSTPQDQIDGKAPKDRWFLLEVDHPLVVPIKEKIRLLVTSNDVIHDWWVPELGVKQDAIPGYVNENWMYIEKPGTYRGQCGELCGVHHAFMPIVVKAVTKADFLKWVDAKKHGKSLQLSKKTPLKKMTRIALMTNGKGVYEKYCVACHQKSGMGLPPTFPAIKGSPIGTGPLKAHMRMVLLGKPGTSMQAFGEQLDDKQIAEVITYQRNSWGNDTIIADYNRTHPKNKRALVVQAKQVKQFRQAQ